MGTYSKVAGLVQGYRPVYQQPGSAMAYLFYLPSIGSWLVGPNYTSPSARVQSVTGSLCPEQATGWQAATASGWVSTYPIVVVPAAGDSRSARVRMLGARAWIPRCDLNRAGDVDSITFGDPANPARQWTYVCGPSSACSDIRAAGGTCTACVPSALACPAMVPMLTELKCTCNHAGIDCPPLKINGTVPEAIGRLSCRSRIKSMCATPLGSTRERFG